MVSGHRGVEAGCMSPPRITPHCLPLLPLLLILLLTPAIHALSPSPAASVAFDAYTARLELRLGERHRSRDSFLAAVALPPEAARLRMGEVLLERLTPGTQLAGHGALLHDWRATAFVPNARSADFDHLLRDTAGYPRVFAPQVLQAKALTGPGEPLQLQMRVEQHHGLTVTLDTTYNITFGQLDPQHAWSTSRSTGITELEHPGTSRERSLTPDQEHGFLWRQNTYWSYEERDGGLYLQLESVSLTRDIPLGLGWIAGPYLNTIPRESLAFTLRSACQALRVAAPKRN